MMYDNKIVYYCTKDDFIAQDVSGVTKIDLRTSKDELNQFFGQPLKEYEEYLQAVIAGKWEDYVIYEDGKIVARAAVWWFDNYYGDITSVAVLPEYQKKGYATKLTAYLTKLILEKGKCPTISTDLNNYASRRVVEKVGFLPEN